MKVIRAGRPNGSPLWQIAVIALLFLFPAAIFKGLYDNNAVFREVLFREWWPWGLFCIPALWSLWLICDSAVMFATRGRAIELLAFETDPRAGTLRIRFRPVAGGDFPVPAEWVEARFQFMFTGGFPVRFRCQETRFDETEQCYDMRVEAGEKLARLGHIWLYIRLPGIVPCHCIYRIHRFPVRYD
ncbi:MAG: hypothetical protein HPZ91_14050 [Lentisphaeria bacterium]|nr:hypothetical protein [Lentisphaeria bacterium]